MKTLVNPKIAGTTPQHLGKPTEPAKVQSGEPIQPSVGETVVGIEDEKSVKTMWERNIDPGDSPSHARCQSVRDYYLTDPWLAGHGIMLEILLSIWPISFATLGTIAPAATTTNPAKSAHSRRSCPCLFVQILNFTLKLFNWVPLFSLVVI
jgi:hypothetical protein